MLWAKDGAREFPTKGDEVVAWIEKHCVLTDGQQWVGMPFLLMGWQKRLLYELFEINPETMRRRYRLALIGVGRKNGKSELAAAIAHYLAFGAGDATAKVYIAAASEDQAGIVFGKCKTMAEKSPQLGEALNIPVGERVSGPRITLKSNPLQYIERLSAKGTTKHGLNPAAVILDELHCWSNGQGDELYQALTTAMAAQPEGLILAITTAGADLETSRCGALYQLGKRLQAGEVDDPTFLFRWWEAEEGCRIDDPAAWRAANPSLGLIADEAFYRGELVRVPEADFRRLYLDQWIDYSQAPWVQPAQIKSCRAQPFELRAGVPTWVGVDIGETNDPAAVDAGQWWSGERPCGHTGDPCLYLRAKTWERPRGPGGRFVDDWEVPQAEVKEHIRERNHDYRVLTNVFDPWHSKLMRQDLEGEGMTCEEIWQSGARRSGASATLYDLIVQERLHYCDDVFERHVLNATTVPTGKDGGYYLAKRRKGRPMDAAMAAVNVVYGTMGTQAEAETRPPLLVFAVDDE